jgi:hypothetical protein
MHLQSFVKVYFWIYTEIEYDTEKELENLAVKNQYALFGENTTYFDKKMLITSIAKISKVPVI